MKRIKTLTALAATLCCLASTSQATLLLPGASGVPPLGPATPPGGAPFVGVFSSGTLDGSVSSWVAADPANPFGLGALTFYYQVLNSPPGASPVEHFTASGFAGLGVDVTTILVGGVPTTSADRTFFGGGDVVTFDWPGAGAILDGFASDILVVHTSYTGPVGIRTGGVIDGFGTTALILAPVPEPTTMIAGALLLLPFAASTVRKLRRA